MKKIKIDNNFWLTLTIVSVLYILARIVLLTNRMRKMEIITSLRNYENEKERLTKRYDETNMRINEIHHIIANINNSLTNVEPDTTKIQVVQQDGFSNGGAG